jgi:phytanoyl-CoA hydroxylase
MERYNLTQAQKDYFQENGYLLIENIITEEEIQQYRDIYTALLDGTIDTGKNRSDLGVGLGDSKKVENITQIMWPSDFVPGILSKAYHSRALAIAKELQGDDIEMDFDMLINKAPFTNTPTPWHQDAAYWIKMPDTRAASCWLALDDAVCRQWLYVVCTGFAPVATAPTFKCFKGRCETEGVPVEIKAGSCVLHQGGTLHYSRGNSTDSQRRAFIVNFRPAEMIRLERAEGFDHGRTGNAAEREVRNAGSDSK